MGCLCEPFRGWMDKTKDLSAFERGIVVGASHTGLFQELQRCWVFHAQQCPVWMKNSPPLKGHPDNFTQLWEALESTWGQHSCGKLSTPCRVNAPTNWGCSEGKRGLVQHNIRKVFLMFGILSVGPPTQTVLWRRHNSASSTSGGWRNLACHPKPWQTSTDAQSRASCRAWYSNCTVLNRKALQRVVRSAQRITGGKLPALHDTYTTRCYRKAIKIIKDNNHPSHCLFTPLSSGKQGQYRCIKAGTERLKNSFYLKAIRLRKSHH